MGWWDNLLGGGSDDGGSSGTGSSSSGSGSSGSSSSSGTSSSSGSSSSGGGWWSGVTDTIDRARDTVEDTASDVGRSIGGAVDRARDTVDDTVDDVSRDVDRTVDDVSRSVDRTVDDVSRDVDRAADQARDTVDDVVDDARDTARDVSRDVGGAVDRARDTVDDTVDDVSRSVDRTRDRVEDTARDVSRDVDRAADRARETADRTVDDARNTARDVGRSADRAVDQAQQQVGNVATDVEQTADDVGQAIDEGVTGAKRTAMSVSYGAQDAVHRADRTVDEIRHGADQAVVEGYRSYHEATRDGTGEVIGDAIAGDYVGAGRAAIDVNRGHFEKAGEEVSPHVYMVADEEGLKARRHREEVFADRAEQGWEGLQRGELPSGAEAGAMWFQTAEAAEWAAADVGHDIREGSPTAGMGPEVLGDPIGSYPGLIAEGALGGVGAGVGAGAQWPVTAWADLNIPGYHSPDYETLAEDGRTPSQVSGGAGDMFVRGGERQLEYAKEHPGVTAAMFALPAAETGTKFVRGYRGASAADVTVPYRAITDESGAKGGISRFETRPGEPTSKAVSELSRRAADQPDAVKRAAGSEEVLYHTTGDRLPSELQVGEGASELPGLWVAGDANSVGLRGTAFGGRQGASLMDYLRPSRPDLSTSTDRVAGFQGDRIAGMPEWAQGAAYEVRGPGGEVLARGLGRGQAKARAAKIEGAEVAPDTSTAGYEFLSEGAEPGTAYVRPRGSRTPEQEAIFGPGSEFARTRGPVDVAVNVGGREVAIPESVTVAGREVSVPGGGRSFFVGGETLPMDFFRRAGEPAEGAPAAAEAAAAAPEGSATAADVAGSYRPTSELGGPSGVSVTEYGVAIAGAGAVPEMTGYNPADLSETPTYTTGPERAGDPSDMVNPYDPYNGGSVFGESGATHIMDVDPSLVDPAAAEPTSTEPAPPESSPPTSAPAPDPGVYYSAGPIDETGITQASDPTSPTSGTSTTGSTPTSTSPSGPSSPPTSPPSGPESGPPSEPPPSTPTSTSVPPSPPSTPSTPTYPDEPSRPRPPTVPDRDPWPRAGGGDRDRNRDEDDWPPWRVDPYDVAFANPIATGLEVLFGNIGPSSYPSKQAGRPDMAAGPYRPYVPDEAAARGGMIDEGMVAAGPIDEGAGRGGMVDEAASYEWEFTGPAYRPSTVEAGGPAYEPAEGPYRPPVDEASGQGGPIDETGGYVYY